MGYGEDALAYVLGRDYGVTISGHGVGNILKRAGLLEKRKKKVRTSRQLSDRVYAPGEVGQMDVKHWTALSLPKTPFRRLNQAHSVRQRCG